MKIKINRNTLLAINTFASKDASRYIINGIAVQVNKAGRCLIVGTDGRRIGVMNDGEVIERDPDETLDVIVPINVPMLKSLPSDEINNVILTFNGDNRVTFTSTKSKVSFSTDLLGGNFPKWRHVVPTGSLSSTIDLLFDWRLLAGFTKAADLLLPSGHCGVTLRQKDNGSPILVLIPRISNFVGVLMPMRADSDYSVPEWAKEEHVPAPAAEPVKA